MLSITKSIFVSRNFQIGNSTCPGRHSSMFRQHSRKRLRHDNSKILLLTYRFFSFYLFCPYFTSSLFRIFFLLVFFDIYQFLNRYNIRFVLVSQCQETVVDHFRTTCDHLRVKMKRGPLCPPDSVHPAPGILLARWPTPLALGRL